MIWTFGRLLNLGSYIAPKYTAKKGFELFCTPFNVKLKPKQQEFLSTAENDELEGAEIPNIHVYKWGNGTQKILLVHGWQSHTFRWIKYVLALKHEDFTIYAIDGPGHGNSGGNLMNVPLYEKALKAFIEKYGEMDYYIGHSLGAFTILFAYYNKTITKAKGLCLLACPGDAQDFVDVYTKMLGLSDKTINLIVDNFKSRYGQKPNFFRSDRFAARLNIPTLIIHDERDKEAPFHYAKSLSNLIPHAEILFTKDLGHKLRSPEVVAKVVDFMKAKK